MSESKQQPSQILILLDLALHGELGSRLAMTATSRRRPVKRNKPLRIPAGKGRR